MRERGTEKEGEAGRQTCLKTQSYFYYEDGYGHTSNLQKYNS